MGISVQKRLSFNRLHDIPMSFSLDRDILGLKSYLLYFFQVRKNTFLRESILLI